MSDFQLKKYLGLWHELIHYPSWFQRNDNYNTTAEYTLNKDGTILVHNSTISNGKVVESFGKARSLGGLNFRVDFPMPEVAKLQASGQFIKGPPTGTQFSNPNFANYVIEKIWANKRGDYLFAVVTDEKRESLYVLSRYKNPPLCIYNKIMKYIIDNFDRDRLVQTPHFSN